MRRLLAVAVVAGVVFMPGLARAAVQPPSPSVSVPASSSSGGQGLIDSVLGHQIDLPGEYPLSHYDIGYSTAGFMGSFTPSAVLGWLTNLVFTASKWITAFALWIINYALTFGVARLLTGSAATVATAYQTTVGRLGLQWVFLTLAVAYAGWHALRGRFAHGVGEALMSFLVATLLAGVLAAPATTLLGGSNGNSGLLGYTRNVALWIGGFTLDPQNAGHGTVSAPVLGELQHTLVDLPYQVINWGEVIQTEPAPCRAAYQHILANGPWGTDDEPRTEMTTAGCKSLADFNANPTPDRLFVTILALIATMLACVLLVVMAFTIVGAQISLATLVCVTPFALAAGLLPGSGRRLLIQWATGVLRALVGVIMTVATLTLSITLASALLGSSAAMPLAVRMGMLDVSMIAAFLFRRRLMQGGRRAADRIGHRIENVRLGNGGARHRGLSPAMGGAAVAEAWADRAEHGIAARARREMRLLGMGHMANRRLARTLHGPQSLRERITSSRTVRLAGGTARAARKATGIALASTVGVPVYLPRAAKAAKVASKARAAKVRTRVARGRTTAKNFGREYVHNLTAPARLAKRVSNAHRADSNQPPPAGGRRRQSSGSTHGSSGREQRSRPDNGENSGEKQGQSPTPERQGKARRESQRRRGGRRNTRRRR